VRHALFNDLDELLPMQFFLHLRTVKPLWKISTFHCIDVTSAGSGNHTVFNDKTQETGENHV